EIERLLAASQGLDEIIIDATLQPEAASLSVTQTLTLTNREPAALTELALRLYPNAFRSEETSPAATEELHSLCYPNGFSEGGGTMQTLSVNGKKASFTYGDAQNTLLRIPLTDEWLAGGTVSVTAEYTLQLPQASHRFGFSGGVFTLGNAFLIPAVYEDGAYRSDPYSSIGDPFYSQCANYHVTLRVPKGYECGASAYAAAEERADGSVYRFEALAARDFALCVSNGYHAAQETRSGVLLTAYALTGQNADKLLSIAAQAMDVYQKRFGPYPYPSFTLCEVDFPFGGMEYPGFVMVGGATLATDEAERTIAHETAHQWWYAVVGSDQINLPWQDEALCEYSVLAFVQDTQGSAAREEFYRRQIEFAMREHIAKGITPGSPIDYFITLSEYATVVYDRGAALLDAIDKASGGKMDEVLRAYYEQYAFKIASRQDFERVLTEVTGQDLLPLMTDYLDTYLEN
ncbi:MAG: M1 family peptidase, partial [Clostridia bacterium]|nr:M1 family peptidase [Clostridia bacterium]